MSNFVEQINDAIKVRVAAVLGATYSEMAYVTNPEKNNNRNGDNKYGVRPLSAGPFKGPLRSINTEQIFEIILGDTYVNRDSDVALREATFVLYTKMDDIFKDLLGTKAGIADVITLIKDPSMDAPEDFKDDNFIVLRGSVSIQWRRPTS